MQLAHAMLACGYDLVVPVSWGEELLAEHTLRTLDARGGAPVVHCACPTLRERLLAAGDELAPYLLTLVAPVVATARYVRALYPNTPLHVTVVGGCPGVRDASIDSRIRAHDFLQLMASRGIALDRMPAVFDSIIPPDRRRHYSLPGGCPAPKALESRAPERRLVTITEDDFSTELAEHLLVRESVLIDLSARLGCPCCGGSAANGTTGFVHGTGVGREMILRHEPPRAPTPVVEHELDVRLELSASAASAASAASEGGRTGRERAAERSERQGPFRLPGVQPIGSARAERSRIAVTPAGVADVPVSGRSAPSGAARAPTTPRTTAGPLPRTVTPATSAPVMPGAAPVGRASEGAREERGRAVEGGEREVTRVATRADASEAEPASPPTVPPASAVAPPAPTSSARATGLAHAPPARWSATSVHVAPDDPALPPPSSVGGGNVATSGVGTTAVSTSGLAAHSRLASASPAAPRARRRFLLGRGAGHPRVHASGGKLLPRAYARHTPPAVRAIEAIDEAVRLAPPTPTRMAGELPPLVGDERAPAVTEGHAAFEPTHGIPAVEVADVAEAAPVVMATASAATALTGADVATPAEPGDSGAPRSVSDEAPTTRGMPEPPQPSRPPRRAGEASRGERREPRSLAVFLSTVVLIVAIVVALAVIFRRPPTAP